MKTVSVEPAPVFAVATTTESTRHAITIAHALAANRHTTLSIIAAPPERVTVSSARAHVHDLPVDDWDPNPAAPVEVVRALAAVEAPEARIVVAPSTGSRDIPALLPTGATVVLGGPIRHFLGSREQRLARSLKRNGYEVVFIPSDDN